MTDKRTSPACNKLILVAAFTCVSPNLLIAGELQITPNVNTTGYVYQTESESRENVSNQALVINTKVIGIYDARKASASVMVDHTYVQQKNDDPGADKSFTELKYTSDINLIDRIMSLSLSGGQSYRVLDASQGLVNDKVLAAGELTKISTNSAELNLSVPNPQYLGATVKTSYSNNHSDESLTSNQGIDSQNMQLNAQIYQGSRFKRASFYLASSYNNTKRAGNQDFVSTISSAHLGFGLSQDIKLVLVGNDNNYDVNEQNVNSQRANLDTTSYGAGLMWQPSDNRSVELTYNKLDEGEMSSRFVGLNTNWALSSRTAVAFDYSKRFYGDAYDFSFNYNLKSFRSSASYNETVTSYSRLSLAEGSSSLFVCPISSSELAGCFQPESLQYVLQAGEEFREAGLLLSDVTNEVLFSKTGRLNLGYDKGRLKAALNLSINTTEYLESDRQQERKNLGLSLYYQLGRRSNVALSSNFSTVNYIGSDRKNDVMNISASFKRTLSKQLSMDVTARYLDQETEDKSQNLTDSRLTVSLDYRFD
ncbi:MAG: hypothetical protein ACI8R9_001090 [Paraglaciecola sp.]